MKMAERENGILFGFTFAKRFRCGSSSRIKLMRLWTEQTLFGRSNDILTRAHFSVLGHSYFDMVDSVTELRFGQRNSFPIMDASCNKTSNIAHVCLF